MGKKLTIEYIRDEFNREGYTLLSEEYVNSKTKMDYICSKGHRHNTSWVNWKHGSRCPSCYGKVKLTLEQVRESFENDNYTLLSNEYINSKQKLHYICPEGHRHDITWGNWQHGSRCLYCSGKVKHTLEKIRFSFEKEGCVLLSKEYDGAFVKLDYICSSGHKHSIKWNDWQQGYRCPICANINSSINRIGSGNPSWQGGISCNPYCEIWRDKEYKKDIRERDGNRCLNPYCCSKNQSDLTIHHIDYNKRNCHPNNLITICKSCNNKANKDRDWHTTWYQAIIKNRYGGIKCL
jgi:hypothetical protein